MEVNEVMKGSPKAKWVFLFILPHEIKWHRFEMDERTSLSKPQVPGLQLSGQEAAWHIEKSARELRQRGRRHCL